MGAIPTFLICGTPKGGTTALASYLKMHSRVFIPEVKEVEFFTKHYSKGLKWYLQHFTPREGEDIIGEASPYYMNDTLAIARIYETIRNVQIILVLRNPIERAYSHYWYYVMIGCQDANERFSDAIETEFGQREYIELGFYWKAIANILKLFQRTQIQIVLSEELFREPELSTNRCLEFLGANPFEFPKELRTINKTAMPTRHTAVLGVWNSLKRSLRSIVPPAFLARTRNLRNWGYDKLYSPKAPPKISKAGLARLRSIYLEEIASLEEFLGRELTTWK